MSSIPWTEEKFAARYSGRMVRMVMLAMGSTLAVTNVSHAITLPKVNVTRDINNVYNASIVISCTQNDECGPLCSDQCQEDGTCIHDGICRGDGDSAVREPLRGSVSTTTVCDSVAIAVAVSNAQTVNFLGVEQGALKSLDANLESVLTQAMAAAGLLDSETEHLFFQQYNPPSTACAGKINVTFTIKAMDPGSEPKVAAHVAVGVSPLKDLQAAKTTGGLQLHASDELFEETAAVPAASAWGLVCMTLALLIIARLPSAGRCA